MDVSSNESILYFELNREQILNYKDVDTFEKKFSRVFFP